MKPKVLVTREVFDEVLNYLSQYFEVTSNPSDIPMDSNTLSEKLYDKEGALITLSDKIDATLLSRCPNLKAVCNIAVGYNNIDLDACTKARVMATNTPGVLDDTTGDFTWALILATARRLTEAEAYLRNGQWDGWKLKQFLGLDVHHATLGIFGFGRIGQVVAKRAIGFEMKIIYHDIQEVPPEIEKACHANYVSKEELLAQADIVTIHVPYSPATYHLIGERELEQMKPTSILINASRGGVVDDSALIDALRKGTIAGAGLDVFENEPKLNPHFLELKNVVLSPHIASSSRNTRVKMAMLAAQNLVAALNGKTPPNLLNPF
ncbi:MAG: D-glycerate dehydrogenase [Syntrophaceae bacterium]|nr:D-glycerate dehydrogenase [Syntrophaceae bacterium]